MNLFASFSLPNKVGIFHKALITFLFLILCTTTNAQLNPGVTELIQMVHSVEKDTFTLNYSRYDRYNRVEQKGHVADSLRNINLVDSAKYDLRKGQENFLRNKHDQVTSIGISKDISHGLYQLERNNFSETELTPNTLKILQSYTDLKALSILLEFVTRHRHAGNTHYSLVREKLINSISKQMNIMADNNLPWYNYETRDRKGLKGIQLEHGNDLLTFGIGGQTNNDMDYTGALKLSLITDLFKMRVGAVNKSYQVFTYGGEVYTPYFKDTAIFIKNDTFNILDRPHACFHYVGFENHGISDDGMRRWVTDVKVGIIGGRFGYNFQNILHRDISLSPAPVGWDAQIDYPGRLAFQLRNKWEFLFLKKTANYTGSGIKFIPSFSGEAAVGYFMTYAQAGLNISTHNFIYKNSHNTLSKTRYSNNIDRMKRIRFFGDYDISLRGVIHNTTLEGHGMFKTNEDDDKSFAEPSVYKLDKKNVRRAVLYNNLTLGLQFPSFNLFYRYSIKSPEYKSTGTLHTFEGEVLDPSTRWHQWATIGVTFVF